jgi:RND family efflux transporter MFP subunit
MLLFTIALAAGCGGQQPASAPEEEAKIPVRTTAVLKSSLQKSINLGGLLAPQDEIYLSAKSPAFKVLHNLAAVGDEVSAGQTLITFDGREIDLQLEQARLSYQRNLALFEAGAVSQAQLEQLKLALDNLELQKESLLLTSPINGVIASFTAVEGQLAGAQPLASVVNIDKLKLKVQVGEANIGKLRLGEEMEVVIPAADRTFTGLITAIAPQIDNMTKAYPVTLEMDNPDRAVKGGMYAEIKLVVESKDDVIVIPQSAILEQDRQQIVFVVENDIAKMKTVQVGLTLGNAAEITEGLSAGEQIIVEGQYAVKDGSPVEITRGEK